MGLTAGSVSVLVGSKVGGKASFIIIGPAKGSFVVVEHFVNDFIVGDAVSDVVAEAVGKNSSWSLGFSRDK